MHSNSQRNTRAMKIIHRFPTKHIKKHTFSAFWFIIGFSFAAMCLLSIVILYYQHTYKDKVIPGVFVDNVYVGSKTYDEVEEIFLNKNNEIDQKTIQFTDKDYVATASAKDLNIGYNSPLMAEQALGLGKSSNVFSNFYIILNSQLNGTFLDASFTVNTDRVKELLDAYQKQIYKEPVDAQFAVENNRVVAFKQSEDGQSINFDAIKKTVGEKVPFVIRDKSAEIITIPISVDTLEPETTTEEANDFGIVEIIGQGNSQFVGSIPNRIHNVGLAASRINGVLVAPGEEFSFVKNLGDVSKYTGYKEAYVISGGRTVLGDGGGVCQVSTTLFRAILNAGLPITERNAHSYRVGYYEQDSGPGLDATVYVPSVDLKFKNDTENHILVQSFFDPTNATLQFVLYGKKDGRTVTMSAPVISNQSPAPEPLYQDDPTLPNGTVKQVDFAAAGATASFTRTVEKDGKVLISDKFTSRYAPWRAVFLKGTKTD